MLLNLEPDHLDRHGTFEAYRAAKLRLFENQAADDVAVVPRGFGAVPGGARRVEFAADDALPAEPLIPGPHNRENAAAATAAARAAGIDDDGDRGRRCGRSPACRTGSSRCAELGGVRYVNDSKATNTAAARRALRAFDAPLHLILGGSREGRAVGRARAGGRGRERRHRVPDRRGGGAARGRPRLRERPVPARGTLERAVAEAASAAEPGDVVLLSPACASYDQFATTSSAERSSGGSYRTSKGEGSSRPARAAPARPRDARARRVRPRDGLQRHLCRGGARQRRPDHVPEAAGRLRAARRSRCWSSPRASTTAGCGARAAAPAVARSRSASPCSSSRRRSTARRRWLTAGPLTFQPSELAKLALLVWAAAYLSRKGAPRTLGELGKPVGLVTASSRR